MRGRHRHLAALAEWAGGPFSLAHKVAIQYNSRYPGIGSDSWACRRGPSWPAGYTDAMANAHPLNWKLKVIAEIAPANMSKSISPPGSGPRKSRSRPLA